MIVFGFVFAALSVVGMFWFLSVFALSAGAGLWVFRQAGETFGWLSIFLAVPIFVWTHMAVRAVSMMGGIISLALGGAAAWASWTAAGDIMPSVAEMIDTNPDRVGAFVLANQVGTAVVAFLYMGGIFALRLDPLTATIVWIASKLFGVEIFSKPNPVTTHPLPEPNPDYVVTLTHPEGGGWAHQRVPGIAYDERGRAIVSTVHQGANRGPGRAV